MKKSQQYRLNRMLRQKKVIAPKSKPEQKPAAGLIDQERFRAWCLPGAPFAADNVLHCAVSSIARAASTIVHWHNMFLSVKRWGLTSGAVTLITGIDELGDDGVWHPVNKPALLLELEDAIVQGHHPFLKSEIPLSPEPAVNSEQP